MAVLNDFPGHGQGGERSKEEELGDERYPSALPLLPPLTDATINVYFQFYATACAIIIIFGGLLSPILEVRLGIGGVTSPRMPSIRPPIGHRC